MLNVDGKAQWATTAYAQINIPVFHWGEMRQNVRLSRTQEWTKELERSQLKDQVSKELNNAWVNVTEISKKAGDRIFFSRYSKGQPDVEYV